MEAMWIMTILTAFYVIFTGILAWFTYSSVKESKSFREDMWNLEEKKVEDRRMALKKVIVWEIGTNNANLIDKMEKGIKEYLEGKIGCLPEIEFPEVTVYQNSIIDIGMLKKEEVDDIMSLYRRFRDIKSNYEKVKRKSSNVSSIGQKQFLVETLRIEIKKLCDDCFKVVSLFFYQLYG